MGRKRIQLNISNYTEKLLDQLVEYFSRVLPPHIKQTIQRGRWSATITRSYIVERAIIIQAAKIGIKVKPCKNASLIKGKMFHYDKKDLLKTKPYVFCKLINHRGNISSTKDCPCTLYKPIGANINAKKN